MDGGTRVIDCGSAPVGCHMLMNSVSFLPSIAAFASPLVAVADAGV